jgi:DNA-binding response OmpR family regulator
MHTSPARILYVDDNQDSCDLVSLMLYNSDNNYSVTPVSTAEEALSAMENQTFDLYILDWWLPEMPGIDLCQKIRETDNQTPIMFFTAMAQSSFHAEGIKAGANEYLVKPDDLDKLTQTVKRLLNRNRSIYKRRPASRFKFSSII